MKTPARPKICPVDGAMLQPRGKHENALHGCAKCNGIWVPAAQLQQLVAARPGGKAAPSLKLLEDAGYGGRHRSCAHCRNERLRLVRAAGIELDVCPRCRGLWLDAGELEAIVQWHRQQHPAGGSEASRAKYASAVAALGAGAGAAVTAAAAAPALDSRKTSDFPVLDLLDGFDFVTEMARAVYDSSGITVEFAGEAAAAAGEFLAHVAVGILS